MSCCHCRRSVWPPPKSTPSGGCNTVNKSGPYYLTVGKPRGVREVGGPEKKAADEAALRRKNHNPILDHGSCQQPLVQRCKLTVGEELKCYPVQVEHGGGHLEPSHAYAISLVGSETKPVLKKLTVFIAFILHEKQY